MEGEWQGQRTRPLFSGDIVGWGAEEPGPACSFPPAGTGGLALRLGALRLLLFKLLLVDLLLTCSRLRAPPAAPGSPHWPPRSLGGRNTFVPDDFSRCRPERPSAQGLASALPGGRAVPSFP